MIKRLHAYLVWFIAALFGLYIFLLQGFPSVMIPELMSDFKIDVLQVGFLTSSFFYPYLLFQVPAGVFIDLFGPKRLLLICFTLTATTTLTFALSRTLPLVTTSRILMGLFASPSIIIALCVASRWFPLRSFPLFIGLTELVALFGGIIGEWGLAESKLLFGWRTTLYYTAIFGYLLFFLTLVFVRDWPQKPEKKPRRTLLQVHQETWSKLKTVISIKQVWANGIFSGLIFSIIPGFAALWSIPYLKVLYQVEVNVAAALSSTLFFGACVGNVSAGLLCKNISNLRPLIFSGTSLSLLTFCSIVYIPNIPIKVMFVLFFLLGIFICTYMFPYANVGRLLPIHVKGTSMGFTNLLCISVGAPIVQPLIGYLLEVVASNGTFTVHNFKLAFLPIPLLFILGLILALFIMPAPIPSEEHH